MGMWRYEAIHMIGAPNTLKLEN